VYRRQADGAAFKGYQLSLEAIRRVAVGMVIITALWGWLWYGIKWLLLRSLAGFSWDCRRACSTRSCTAG
jgi:hypothetical protein